MRRVTVTSSLKEMPTNQLGYRARICKRLWSPGIDSARLGIDGSGRGGGGDVIPPPPRPFLWQASEQIFKDDVNDFPPPRIIASWKPPSLSYWLMFRTPYLTKKYIFIDASCISSNQRYTVSTLISFTNFSFLAFIRVWWNIHFNGIFRLRNEPICLIIA